MPAFYDAVLGLRAIRKTMSESQIHSVEAPVDVSEMESIPVDLNASSPARGGKGHMAKKWYVIHAYSGYEKKVKLALEERVRLTGRSEYFDEILVPSEDVVELLDQELIGDSAQVTADIVRNPLIAEIIERYGRAPRG